MNPAKRGEFYLKFGLVLAFPLIIYQYIAYAAGVQFMVSTTGNLIPFALKTALLFIIAKYCLKKAGGTADFSTMFKTIMPVVFFGTLLTVLNEAVLYSVVDPGLDNRVFDASVVQLGGYFKMLGADEDSISSLKSRLINAHYGEDNSDRYSIFGILGAWVTSVVLWVLPVSIISLIMKKEEKAFPQ